MYTTTDKENAMSQNLKSLAARGVDALCHSSVQPWSAGPLFPAVIAKVERYVHDPLNEAPGFMHRPLADRLETQWWELTLDGRTEQYASREDAEMVARRLVSDPIQRAKWNARRYAGLVDSEIIAWQGACERSVREGV